MATILPFPLQYQRQQALPIDVDQQFETTAARVAYLSSPRRYAGMQVYDIEADATYMLNGTKDAWREVAIGSNYQLLSEKGQANGYAPLNSSAKLVNSYLDTINSNVGTFGNSVTVPTLVVNAQGRLTAVSETAIPTASTSIAGLLSATDWNTFNTKQNALGYIPVNIAGDTMLGDLIAHSANPINALSLTPRVYVDNAIAGLKFKTDVLAASIANVNVSSAPATLDNVTLTSGDRILLKNQTAGAENGIYIYNGTGSALTRSTDADTGSELANKTIPVTQGTVNQDTWWTVINDTITIGTTVILFTQTGGAGTYTNGAGLNLIGNVFSVANGGVTNAMLANATISGISLGNNLADLTATNSTLTFTGTYNGSTARSIGLNLSNGNNWLATQQFTLGIQVLNANNNGSGNLSNFIKASSATAIAARVSSLELTSSMTATSGTTPTVRGLGISQITNSGGHTITYAVGAGIYPVTVGTNNTTLAISTNYEIITGNWSIYNSGSNSNYFASKILIGTTTDAGYTAFDFNGTGRISGTTTINGITNITTPLTVNSASYYNPMTIIQGDYRLFGSVATLSTITQSGLTAGTYTAVSTTGGSGSGLTLNVVVSGSTLTATINNAGTNYLAGDLITVNQNSIGGSVGTVTFTVNSVTSANSTRVDNGALSVTNYATNLAQGAIFTPITAFSALNRATNSVLGTVFNLGVESGGNSHYPVFKNGSTTVITFIANQVGVPVQFNALSTSVFSNTATFNSLTNTGTGTTNGTSLRGYRTTHNTANSNISFNSSVTVLRGSVASLTIISGGTGYTNGSYSVNITGGSGTGLICGIVVSGGVVTSIGIVGNSPGSNYIQNETVSFSGTGTGFAATVNLRSETMSMFSANDIFNTTGADIYRAFNGTPTINQTGGATGDIFGFYWNPILTALLGRNIAFQNVSGDVILNSTSGNTIIGGTVNAGFKLDNYGTSRFQNNITFTALNLILDTTTGTKIGTATSQKLSLWNATPIIQPTTSIAAATFVSNTSLIVDDTATFDGYTIGQIVKALRNIGALA